MSGPWTDPIDWLTANIGRGVSPAVKRRNIVKVRRVHPGPPLPLVNWQEIDEADDPPGVDHRLLDAIFADGYLNVGMVGKEPISIPTRALTLGGPLRRDLIMHGIAPDRPGAASPDRFLVRQKVVPRRQEQALVMANFHLANLEPRDPRWKASLDRVKALLRADADAGHTVVYACDSNANRPANMPRMHPKERRVVAKGNDYIGIIPGATRVRVHGTFSVNLTIDGHNAEGVRLSFRDA